MGNLTPIQSLTPARIRAAMVAAVDGPSPIATIADYLADVDWSTVEGPANPEVVTLLGRLHELATAIDEGDVDRATFLEAVRSLARTPTGTPGL
jgi:hypothetical protein